MVDGDGYGRFFVLLLSLITLLTLFISREYADTRRFSGDEFYGLILFAALGMMLVSSATHWVVFFLGLELFSIALYVLIGVQKQEPSSTEAALKYLIMGAVASGFITFGMAMVYAATGTMDIARSLAGPFEGPLEAGLSLGLGLILVGVGFKLSLVPFHLWTPDVYQGAPLPVTAFLSTGSKVALIAALLRISLSASDDGLVYAPADPLGACRPNHDDRQCDRRSPKTPSNVCWPTHPSRRWAICSWLWWPSSKTEPLR